MKDETCLPARHISQRLSTPILKDPIIKLPNQQLLGCKDSVKGVFLVHFMMEWNKGVN